MSLLFGYANFDYWFEEELFSFEWNRNLSQNVNCSVEFVSGSKTSGRASVVCGWRAMVEPQRSLCVSATKNECNELFGDGFVLATPTRVMACVTMYF